MLAYSKSSSSNSSNSSAYRACSRQCLRQLHIPAVRATAGYGSYAPTINKTLLLPLPLLLQLRFNKVAELIHNSTNHRNLERACVTVHFQEIIDLVSTR
jgi:hypothetical protein